MSGSPAAKATTQCNRLPAPPFRWCREFVAIYARLTACEVLPLRPHVVILSRQPGNSKPFEAFDIRSKPRHGRRAMASEGTV